MSFKKIDEDCVNGDQPFDSFVLKGIQENMRDAFVNRPKRGAISFANDIRPQFGSVATMVLPLCVFPLSENAVSASIRLFLDILDADVYISPVILSTDGKNIIWEGDLEVFEPGYDQFIDLSYNTQGLYRLAILGISFSSEIDETTKVTIGNSVTDVTLQYSGRLEFDSAVTDLDPDKRQIIEIVGPRSYGVYNIINVPPSKESVKIHPYWYPDLITTTDWSFSLINIGSFRLSGMAFKEGFDNAAYDQGTRLDPGSPPSAFTIQTLHGAQRALHTNRTPIHHIGPVQFREIQDIYGDTYSRYGTRILANDQTWRTIATDVFVQRDTDKIVVDPTIYTRRRSSVAGIIDSGINRNDLSQDRTLEYLTMQIRAVCYSFDRIDEKWNEDDEFYERTNVDVRIREGGSNWIYQDYRSYLLGCYPRTSFNDPVTTTLRDVPSNFSVFFFEWEDTYDTRRRFMIQANGDTETKDGTNIVGYDYYAYIPTLTVWTSEVVR